jgi:fructokinase
MSFKVVGIGEVLWDLLPSGPQPGGAPANFAYHAHALGALTRVITRVGNDQPGREIINRLEDLELSTDGVQVDSSAPTGTAAVALSGEGVPEYIIHDQVAWDNIAVTPEALALVHEADAVCFGSLAQRNSKSRQAIQQLVSATPAQSWRIFDINLRQNFYNRDVIEQSLNLANVLKLNESELPILTRMFGNPGTVRQQIQFLARRFNLPVVALTCGPEGSRLYRDGVWSEQPAGFTEVKDTVGAGDSFTAALCMGLLEGLPLDEVNIAANKIAAHVCSCIGATPKMPAELRGMFHASKKDSETAAKLRAVNAE